MGALEELWLSPVVSRAKKVLSLPHFPAVGSYTREYPGEHSVSGSMGDSVGNPLEEVRQRVGECSDPLSALCCLIEVSKFRSRETRIGLFCFVLATRLFTFWEWKSLSRVRLFVTPWTIVHQAPLFMGFSRQEYWTGLPFLFHTEFEIYQFIIGYMIQPEAEAKNLDLGKKELP